MKFNPLLDKFPTEYKGIKLNTDFRVGILLSLLFNSGKFTDEEKKLQALSLLYGDDYKDKTNCAYLINRYYNPMINRFFTDKGVKIEEDIWALSELIQWLFRSAIREEKEVNLYMPSSRMRSLLKDWLNK